MSKGYQYNLKTFYNEDALTYYLLGVFMTDGCIRLRDKNSGTVHFSSKDEQWVRAINAYICPDKQVKKRPKQELYWIEYYSNELAKWFINHNCVPNKSLILNIPPQMSDDHIPSFLRGCWDGDGSLSFQPKNHHLGAALYTGSDNFAHSIKSLIEKINIKSFIYERKRNQTNFISGQKVITKSTEYAVQPKNGSETYKLCKLLYPKNCISLQRKYDTAQQIIRYKEEKLFLQP